METNDFKIYGLVNPDDNVIFYVGCTNKTLRERLRHHYDSTREAANTDRRKISKRHQFIIDIYPTIADIVLLDVANETNWQDKEREYIAKYRLINPNLTNVADGGIGGDTYSNLSDEDKAIRSEKASEALTGRAKPEGFGEALSKARKGTGNPRYGFSKYGKIVHITEDNVVIKTYEAGIEFVEEFGDYYYGNLIKALSKATYLEKYHFMNNAGYWNFEHNLKFNPIPNGKIVKKVEPGLKRNRKKKSW